MKLKYAIHARPLTRVLVLYAAFAVTGCECQSDGPIKYEPAPLPPVARFEVTGEPVLHNGKRLTPEQQKQAAELIALVKQYYPVWDRERMTMDEYYMGYEQTPEIRRFKALIEQRAQDPAWNACLADFRGAFNGPLYASNGNPPGFYIPSFQVVVSGRMGHGHISMVFRLSMLAPLYDYYEYIGDVTGTKLQFSLTPTRDTRAFAQTARDIIAKHFPDYRELAPEIGTVRLRDMHVGNLLADDEVSLADALFEANRSWW